jgi:hypothetical protein
VVLFRQLPGEGFLVNLERFDATSVDFYQCFFATHDRNRRPALSSRFGEQQRAVFEIKCSEAKSPGNLCPRFQPAKTASDHQMNYDPEIVLEPDCNPLSDSANLANSFAFDLADWWID